MGDVEKRILADGKIQYRVKRQATRRSIWMFKKDLVNCHDLLTEFEKKRATSVIGIEYVNNHLAYLMRFRDQNEPSLVNNLEARIWSHLTFDFLLEKIIFDGFAQDANAVINPLGRATPDGTPEIMCVTDMMGGISFCLKYSNGIRFEDASVVKANFAELAVAYMEQHLRFE